MRSVCAPAGFAGTDDRRRVRGGRRCRRRRHRVRRRRGGLGRSRTAREQRERYPQSDGVPTSHRTAKVIPPGGQRAAPGWGVMNASGTLQPGLPRDRGDAPSGLHGVAYLADHAVAELAQRLEVGNDDDESPEGRRLRRFVARRARDLDEHVTGPQEPLAQRAARAFRRHARGGPPSRWPRSAASVRPSAGRPDDDVVEAHGAVAVNRAVVRRDRDRGRASRCRRSTPAAAARRAAPSRAGPPRRRGPRA